MSVLSISQSYKPLSVWRRLRPDYLWILLKGFWRFCSTFVFLELSTASVLLWMEFLIDEPAEVQVIDWVTYSKGLSFISHRMLSRTCICKNKGWKQPRPSTSHFPMEKNTLGRHSMWEEEEIPPWQKWEVELCVEVQRLKALEGNSCSCLTASVRILVASRANTRSLGETILLKNMLDSSMNRQGMSL